jgi:transglutaminase-like putative cysteine protease
MTLTAAAAVVLTSTVLFPAFIGSSWFFGGIGAVFVVAAVGTLSRLRTLPVTVCALISLISLVLYLNLIFEASRSIIAVIPSTASMSALWHLAGQGFSDAGKYAAPAPTVPPLLLLATAGIGITAVMTDLIAVRLRSAAMAGLPLLVMFTVPVALNGNRSSISIVAIFTLATCGYLALLSADGRERIRVWGRLISLWRTSDSETKDATPAPGPAPGRSPYQVLRGPDTRSLAAAGRRVGLASIVLALCTPLLIPGLHGSHLPTGDWVIGPGNGGSSGPGLYDPLTAAAQDLKEAKPTTVLTYTTNAPPSLQSNYPQYLRQYAYTTLTSSGGWQPPFSASDTTVYPFNTQLPDQAAGIANDGSPLVQMQISISKTGGFPLSSIDLLPAPYPPVRIYAPGSWEYDPSTLMVVTQHSSLNGLDYSVVSRDVDPKPAALRAAARPPAMAADTQLPSSYKLSAPLLKLALKLTNGSTTEYDKVTAIQNWLRGGGGFTYYTYAPQIENVTNLLNYLTKTKTGDCIQSAYAMTVLLRMIGIPARMAVGFTQGKETTANHYTVKTSDAHAWPEVYFSGYGWLAFAPTPGGGGTALPTGYDGSSVSSTAPQSTGDGNTSPIAPKGNASRLNGHLRPDGGYEGTGSGIIPLTVKPPAAPTPWLALALAVLAALGVICWLISILAPAGHRALAARQAAGPRERVSLGTVLGALIGAGVVVLALYRVLSHTKGLDLGHGWATVGIAFGSAFGAAGLIAFFLPLTCRVVVRRWRWVRAADNDADLAHAAWEELRADLADYGVGYLPSESPRALAGRITIGLALDDAAVAAVSRIAMAEERATYAARPGDAEGLRQDGMTARRGIAAASGRTARWRARLFPASTIAAIMDKGARIPEAWATRIRPRLPSLGSRGALARDTRLDG